MSQTKTILIAEDEADFRKLLSLVLQQDGHRVFSASNPIEAVDSLGTDLFGIDLLVADVAMPGMSGPELARELRGVCPELRVIFMTAAARNSPAATHVDIVNHDIMLQKPFSVTEFKQAVDNILKV